MIYILWGALAISLAINILVIWYIRNLIQVYNGSLKEMFSLFKDFQEFQEQIEKVYNMEIYYGDVTIENMIKSIGLISERIGEFLEKSSDVFGEPE
tara:strand:- start:857 stop:1144 length:288 start_codon:yes stop_codon:yes gene_type:complete